MEVLLGKIADAARGAVFTLRLRLRGHSVGKLLRVGRNCRLQARSGGKLRLGDRVIIGNGTVLSALHGGEIRIGSDAGIGAGSRLICHARIEIGEGCNVAPQVSFYDHDHVFDLEGVHRNEYKTGPITVGAKSWIGAGTIVLRGTEIGEACLIGAGSVVKGTVPSHSRLIQRRETEIQPLREQAAARDA